MPIKTEKAEFDQRFCKSLTFYDSDLLNAHRLKPAFNIKNLNEIKCNIFSLILHLAGTDYNFHLNSMQSSNFPFGKCPLSSDTLIMLAEVTHLLSKEKCINSAFEN